jgi:hypothetical protein
VESHRAAKPGRVEVQVHRPSGAGSEDACDHSCPVASPRRLLDKWSLPFDPAQVNATAFVNGPRHAQSARRTTASGRGATGGRVETLRSRLGSRDGVWELDRESACSCASSSP